MALVTLSAVAEKKTHEKYDLENQSSFDTCLVLPHFDEGLHLCDPFLDGFVHRFPPLDVGRVHLVRLREQEVFVNSGLISPLRELSSSERRRCRCPGQS